MDKMPKTSESCKRFWEMFQAGNKTRLMIEGIKLHIFDALEIPITAGEIAEKYNFHPENTTHFLNALATAGLIEKKQGKYHNLPDTSNILVSGKPGYYGYILTFLQESFVDPLQQELPGLLGQGPTPAVLGTGLADEDFWIRLTRESAAWVIGQAGETAAQIVSGLEGFDKFKTMLDLGGGHGMFALYITDAHPEMKTLVFDKPMLGTVAQEFIDQYDMADRVTILSGDYTKDDIGTGYDLIWASSTLNFARNNLDLILKKIYKALQPGGYFISLQDGLTHEHTQPAIMLTSLLSVMKSGEDLSFDQGEIASAMLRTGFGSVQSRSLDLPTGTMDMDIARKI